MKKGEIYEGYVERMDFPNKGIVVVDEEKAMVKNADVYKRQMIWYLSV